MPILEKEQIRREMGEDYKARMEDSQKEMEEMKKSWEEKLKMAAMAGVSLNMSLTFYHLEQIGILLSPWISSHVLKVG